VASSERISATSSWPTAAMGQVQMLSGPRWVMPKPKFRKMPVVIEMMEKATAKTENIRRVRRSSCR
jgi:hypothetical protein